MALCLKFVVTPTCFGPSGPSSGSVMFLVLKLLVFQIWCCHGMHLGVQVMSACLVDVSVAGRVAMQRDRQQTLWTGETPRHTGYQNFTEKIHRLAPLPNAFNIKNTHDLLRNIKDTPLLPHHSLASLDITNLYSNIPVPETKTILVNLLKHELIAPQTRQEILNWYVIKDKTTSRTTRT